MKRPMLILILFALLSAACGCGKDTPPATATSESSTPSGQSTAPPQPTPEYGSPYPVSPEGEVIINDISAPLRVEDNARVFYEIFVGSFSDSNGDGIGDLRGIINRMDYLNDGNPASGLSLGVEGIWLTPIFKSNSYHKYNVNDYYEIDPDFGTMEDLRELIALCHARDVKLILDLPLNHTGSIHPWFNAFVVSRRRGESDNPYYHFYTCYKKGEAAPAGRSFAPASGTDCFYECNFSTDMPELDFDQEAVRQATLEVAKFYLDMGIDGFRFDAAKYIYLGETSKNTAFWQWYMDELRQYKPDVYAIAEVWDADAITLSYYPAVDCFNFTTAQAEGLIDSTAKAGYVEQYTNYLEKYLRSIKLARGDAMLHSFISNHDMDRASGYLTLISGQMQMAASLYILTPGSPFIYYGEEIGLKGSRGGAATDANRRLAMRWGDGDSVKDPAGSSYEEKNQVNGSVSSQIGQFMSLYNHYKKLIMLRKANPAIARGSFQGLHLPGTKAGGFIAAWQDNVCCVLHNPSRGSETIDLQAISAEYNFALIDGVAGQGSARIENGLLTISGLTSVVLHPAP